MPFVGWSHAHNSNQLFFLDEGNPTDHAIILVHGLGATSESWGLQFPALVNHRFRVIAPDIPGFGQSSCQGGIWSISLMAQAIINLIDQLELGSVTLAGISMGGAIILQAALIRPDLVKRLVLINTFAHLRSRNWKNRMYMARRFVMMIRKGLGTQASFVAERIFPEPYQMKYREELIRQISRADARVYRSAMISLAFYNAEKRLKTIKTPTLVVTGDQDTTVDPRIQSRLARGIPGARHVIVAGAGHAVIADHPDEFNRILLNFLLNP